MTIHERRLLKWEGCPNARDLGGYPTADGRETEWGRILRSDNPYDLSEAGRKALIQSGVRTIIDVRGDCEIREYPSPFADHPGIDYRHIAFVDETQPATPDNLAMSDAYLHMLERDRAGIAAILTAIARAPEGPVLIHCHGGKDRTGLTSALLLRLAGVPTEVVDEDYALTGELMQYKDRAWVVSAPTAEEREQRRHVSVSYAPKGEVMDAVIRGLEERHGSIEGYIRWLGLAQEDIERLRARLLA